MNSLSVGFSTEHFAGMAHGGHGASTWVELETVNGIQLPNSTPLSFTHNHRLPNFQGQGYREVELPTEQALKIQAFSEKHFMQPETGFDCHGFLGYVMGWQLGTKGLPRSYEGRYVKPDETRLGTPYVLIAGHEHRVPHSVLGIDRSEETLGVAGPNYPMVFAKNTDLLRMFNAFAMQEVQITHPLPIEK